MKGKSSSFFWPSFTDLMTSLFFVMLVLYVLTIIKLKIQQQASEEQLKKIKEIQKAVEKLPQTYFTYDSKYKRFSLNREIHFKTGESIINENDKPYLAGVGKSVQTLIVDLKERYSGDNIKYLIVIEGMASNDNYQYNDELSYQRALALYRFWKDSGVEFDTEICDLQIAGSGTRGIGRYVGNEKKNQRFLIHIVPKIGNIETQK
jgi:outer membrane protein OmpA-like peptidoglycan-associated protein